jgi:uncharacterized protein
VKSANAAVKDLVQIQSQITTIPVQETADVGTTTASPSVPTITLQNAQLRASSYVIYVDLPNSTDEMLLVHGYTGAYDVVSRRVATYVRSLEPRHAPKPLYGIWTPEPAVDGHVEAPSEETLKALRRRGYLTELSLPEEEEFLCKLVNKLHERSMKQPPVYIVMPTYDCNLRCSYCFQDYMRTNPAYKYLLHTMSRDLIDRMFRGMLQIERLHGWASESAPHRNIWFFGGEPLLAANRPAIEYITRQALALGTATVSAVTNATELDAYKDLLSPDLIGNLQITLDGPPQEHDLRRIYADGSGSFSRIAQNITMALDRGVGVSVRMNIDRNNFVQLPQLAEVIHEHKWNTYSRFSAYTAPIHAANSNVNKKSTMSSWELEQQLAAAKKEFPILSVIAAPDDWLKNDARAIFSKNGGAPPKLRESFCGAHTGMYIFDAFGDIYACWERTADPSIRIGRLKEDGDLELSKSATELWRSRTVATNPVCRKCRYALHCGGGCAVLAYGSTGDYHTNFCDGFASRFRANVAEAYLEKASGRSVPQTTSRVCG